MKAAVLHRQFVVRQSEVAFQPLQKGGLENPAPAIERVAREPDQFRPAKADATSVIELRDQFFGGEGIYGAAGRTVEQGELYSRPGVMLPDKLQHQQLVEIGIEQGPGHRVQFPVVIVGAFREVHDHSLISSYAVATKANAGYFLIACSSALAVQSAHHAGNGSDSQREACSQTKRRRIEALWVGAILDFSPGSP